MPRIVGRLAQKVHNMDPSMLVQRTQRSWSGGIQILHGMTSRSCHMKHLITSQKRARRFKIGDCGRKLPVVTVLSTNEKEISLIIFNPHVIVATWRAPPDFVIILLITTHSNITHRHDVRKRSYLLDDLPDLLHYPASQIDLKRLNRSQISMTDPMMADMHNRNHGLEFSMIMEDPDQELDWEKDTRHVNLAPWGCYHYPLVYQRWPKHPKPFKRTIYQSEPWYGNPLDYAFVDEERYAEGDDRPYWNSSDARSELEGEYKWPDPAGAEKTDEDGWMGERDPPRPDQTDKYISTGLGQCFMTSFLKLQGSHGAETESILSHLAGEFVERTKPILAAGVTAQQTWTNKHQTTASTISLAETFVDYAGHIGRALFGPDFVNPMLSTSTSTSALQMKMNPALAFPPGHGIIDRHSRPTYTPQIVVLHGNKGPELEMHRAVEKFREDPSWDQVGFVVDVMDHPRKDMKTHSGLKFESAAVSIFRSLVSR
jgi:hypothetical protein